MFPLGTTLVPGQSLPLHIFEPRYVALVEACVVGDGRFGVVLIERGSEVGGGETRFDVGTVAQVMDLQSLPDGEWAFRAVGVDRLRVRAWLPDEPFPRAEIELLTDPVVALDPQLQGRVVESLGRLFGTARQLGYDVPAAVELDPDPMRAAWGALARVGIGPLDVQRILECDDPIARIEAVVHALDETTELLELRLR
ncbi:MAG: LON peptidase substrate-binding domain-containing protein [Acidimicrobiia bacterium]|nr:LON peptidase substrate-binding domain-containing protein [Acidimicrobiia bacterium]